MAATRTLETRFERMTVQDENGAAESSKLYAKGKVRLLPRASYSAIRWLVSDWFQLRV